MVGEEVAFLHRKRRCRSLQHTADLICNDCGRAVTALEALDPGARDAWLRTYEPCSSTHLKRAMALEKCLEVVAVRRSL